MASDVAEKRFLFIAGTARSGTSALAELLCAHSEMIVCNERFYKLANEARIAELTPETFAPERLLYPSPDETHNHDWNNGGPYQRRLVEKYPRVRVLGDKVPHYHHHAAHIAAQFPECRFVFLSRNIFDVANSWQKRKDDPEDVVWTDGYRKAVKFWNADNRMLARLAQRFGPRVAVVSYERLYSYTPHYLRNLLRFLDVADDDRFIVEAYGRATRDWMKRFAQPSVLARDDLAWIAEHAEIELQRDLINAGERW